MAGYARLKRIEIINETTPLVSKNRWNNFLAGMRFEEKIEFAEGDVGLAGGIQSSEPPNLHVITEDTIQRFGGSTLVTMPWPLLHGIVCA